VDCGISNLKFEIVGRSRERDFAKLNLHLPACRNLGAGRGIFEQPGKSYLLSDLLELGCEKEDLHERC
jgi:hypothetical protein